MPTSKRKTSKKTSPKPKPEDSKLYHLPYEIQIEIAQKAGIFDYFMEKLTIRLDYIIRDDTIDLDYNLILLKLKPKFFDDIINPKKIDDKRNFKDFNTKLEKFVYKYVIPLVEYIGDFKEIFKIFLDKDDDYNGDPIRELYSEDLQDYEFDPKMHPADDEFGNMMQQINDMEKRGKIIIPKINKQLFILNKHFNSTLKKDLLNLFNKIIKRYNKLYGKSLPLIDEYKHTSIRRGYRRSSKNRRFTRSATRNAKKVSINKSLRELLNQKREFLPKKHSLYLNPNDYQEHDFHHTNRFMDEKMYHDAKQSTRRNKSY
tara:strand:- start:1622 stop:2566 length:945 start_codon:yes stop_codon:yes gene_type:complete